MRLLQLSTPLVALQDEMIELGEKEATEAVAEKEAAETSAHAALMKQANLQVCCLPCLLAHSLQGSGTNVHRHEMLAT